MRSPASSSTKPLKPTVSAPVTKQGQHHGRGRHRPGHAGAEPVGRAAGIPRVHAHVADSRPTTTAVTTAAVPEPVEDGLAERQHLQDQHEHERDDTERPDVAAAHHLEGGRAAPRRRAEPVGGVGETVEVRSRA